MDQKPKILVVDDDPTQRRLMQAAAEKQGFRARVVENGEKALEEASDAKNGVDAGKRIPILVKVIGEGDEMTIDLIEVSMQVKDFHNCGEAAGRGSGQSRRSPWPLAAHHRGPVWRLATA